MAYSAATRSQGAAIRFAILSGLATAALLTAMTMSAHAQDRDRDGDRNHAFYHDNRDNHYRYEQTRRHELEVARQRVREQERWRLAHRYDGYYRRPDVYYSAPPVIYQPPAYYQQPGGSLTFSFPFFNN